MSPTKSKQINGGFCILNRASVIIHLDMHLFISCPVTLNFSGVLVKSFEIKSVIKI
jgi:hypothetical protein